MLRDLYQDLRRFFHADQFRELASEVANAIKPLSVGAAVAKEIDGCSVFSGNLLT
jgi:hypothetical protein